MLESTKLRFTIGSITIKANTELSRKEKLSHNHYCMDGHLGIDDWDFTIFEQRETHKEMKERESSWQRWLKTFYLLGLNEKEEYLY